MSASRGTQDWQERKEAEGLCTCCGKKPIWIKLFCKACREKLKIANRTRKGYNAWKPGGKGRPPTYILY